LGTFAAPTDPDSFIAYILQQGIEGRGDIKGFQAYTLNGQPAYHIIWYPNNGIYDYTYLFHNGYEFGIPNQLHPSGSFGKFGGKEIMGISDGIISTFKFTN
jgi:hypothetical protein